MTEQNSLEHHIAMTVNGLCSGVIMLSSYANAPESAALLAHDYETLAGAHAQLGRILRLIPVEHPVAAE